jgi:hypothetical protein
VEDKLRFLGVGICRTGEFVPWLDDYVDRLHAMWNKLGNYGFGASPIPFMTAFKIFIQPAIFYGAEIWGILHLKEVMEKGKSPFLHWRTKPLLEFLKQKYGLPKDGFNIPIISLCNIKTSFAVIY